MSKSNPKGGEGPGKRDFAEVDLRELTYYDSAFLALILCDVLPEVADMDELPLSEALVIFDRKFRELGAKPLADVRWQEDERWNLQETSARIYSGRIPGFAVVLLLEGGIDVLFLTEVKGEGWIVTGLADEFESRLRDAEAHDGPEIEVQLENTDESLEDIFASHESLLEDAGGTVAPAPKTREQGVQALDRFLSEVLG